MLIILFLILRNIKKLSGINRHNCAIILWHNYKMKGEIKMIDKKQIERYKKAIDNEDWYTIEKIQKEIKEENEKKESN